MGMNSTPYHHGDLRTAMIEKGIEIINEQGIKIFSLRKLAAACGVSHAATYSHFANKEDLISAISNHITDKFVIVLKESLNGHGDSSDGLLRMGCAYVMFFVHNPQYFTFIFNRANIEINFSEHPSGYEPFDLYKSTMFGLFNEIDYPHELQTKTLITTWAFVHGLASVAIMQGSGNAIEWEERVNDLLSNSYFLGGSQC
jgi:AcrR family transcriptional regulator